MITIQFGNKEAERLGYKILMFGSDSFCSFPNRTYRITQDSYNHLKRAVKKMKVLNHEEISKSN